MRYTDYIRSQLEVLREDDRAIIRAASAAPKAADFLLSFQPTGKAFVSPDLPATSRR